MPRASDQGKAASLQDIIGGRQRAEFVGREGQIVLFRENLDLIPEDPRKRFVFNIHGDGGIGKTYLIRQLEHVVEDSGALHAYVDESAYDIPEAILALADRLDKPDQPGKHGRLGKQAHGRLSQGL